MTKHTPGPWSVTNNAGGTDIMITAPDADHHRGYLAMMAPANKRSEADARLIAAAPQMLEALEAAKLFIENGVEMGYISEPQPGTPEGATLPAIEAAIRAAKGEV